MKAGRARWLVSLAAALFVLGCGGIPPTPPTHQVELAQNSFGRFVLLVYDDTGLVTDAVVTVERNADPLNAAADAHPERNEIFLSWWGGACAHGPKLAVKGDASELSLELDVSPLELSAVPVDCPAIGLFFDVTLTLSEPVEQDALSLTLLSR